jgi:predicted phage terminase large subunit-like protein
MSKLKTVKVQLLPKQKEFVLSKSKITLFIGGIGSGKSFGGAIKALMMPPGSKGLVIAPTYKTIVDATQTTFFRVVETFLGREVIKNHNKSENITTLTNGSEILWRSAENYDILRGLEVDWVWIDEACFLTKEVYDVVLGRLRGIVGPLELFITSSPGTNGRQNWVYKEFFTKESTITTIITQSTIENTYLPSGYVDTLKGQYSSTQQLRELNAQWVDNGGNRIQESWLKRIDKPITGTVTVGVDLAISVKDSADYTALVAVDNTNMGKHVFAARKYKKSFHDSMQEIENFCKEVNAKIVHVENVAFQAAAVQELTRRLSPKGIVVKPVKPKGDKLSRFAVYEASIENGSITFAHNLPGEFIEELIGFTGDGKSHDDYCDSLVYALSYDPSRGSYQFITNF